MYENPFCQYWSSCRIALKILKQSDQLWTMKEVGTWFYCACKIAERSKDLKKQMQHCSRLI